MPTARAALVCAIVLVGTPPCAALAPDGWTELLGLRFKKDCQEESAHFTRWLSRMFSWLSGRRGTQGPVHCETKETLCDSGSLSGLQVRYAAGKDSTGSDRDFYDFNLRCGRRWQGWLGLRFDRSVDVPATQASMCKAGRPVSGIQVLRGRDEKSDRDYFNFRLRCAAYGASGLQTHEWGDTLGLPFDKHRETRSATCPPGHLVDGLRVHRGFQVCTRADHGALAPLHPLSLRVRACQDWGDVDSYEFQLHCSARAPPDEAGSGPAAPAGSRIGQNRPGAREDNVFGARAAGASLSREELNTLRATPKAIVDEL